MILDSALLLSGAISAAGVLSGQAANGAGNILSTNTIDTAPLTIGGNQPSDVGSGDQLSIVAHTSLIDSITKVSSCSIFDCCSIVTIC